jgi:hypothetical protein
MRYYEPKNFRIFDVVDPNTFILMGDKSSLVMDARILWTLDALIKRLGPAVVNDWAEGGKRKNSGYRPPESTLGVRYSQHRFGRALDIMFSELNTKLIIKMIRNKELEYEMQYVTRVELGVPHLHIDCASIVGTEIYYFKP